MKRGVLLIALAVLVGCDGDGPTSAEPLIVAGAWDYTATNVTGTIEGEDFTCFLDLTLQLNQSNETFSGTYAGDISCQSIDDFIAGSVTNGRIDGRQVTFDLDTSDFHHTGTISGASMSGTLTVRLVVDGQEITLVGNWGATR